MGKSNGLLSTITDIFSTADMRERAADKKARKAKARRSMIKLCQQSAETPISSELETYSPEPSPCFQDTNLSMASGCAVQEANERQKGGGRHGNRE